MTDRDNTNAEPNADEVTQAKIPEMGEEDQPENVGKDERAKNFPEEPDPEEAQADLDHSKPGEPGA